VETARALLAAGAEVDPLLPQGDDLLLRQARAGDGDGVRLLLEHDARPKAGSPLLAAVQGGHVEAARALIEHGAPTDEQDEDGKTLLVIAAETGRVELVRLLLAHGVAVGDTGTEESRTSALGFASLERHPEVVDELLAHGADVDARNRSDVTPLMQGAFGGEPAVVRSLLAAGAAVDLENRDGRTALVFAVLLRHPEAVELLLEAGASPEVSSRIPGFGVVTPLLLAAGRGHEEIARLLLDHGAVVDRPGKIEDVGQETPLLLAARGGHTGTVRLLLDHGADPAGTDDRGRSALDWAREGGHQETAALLETTLETRPDDLPPAVN
jgi:ankyrin repeat protein